MYTHRRYLVLVLLQPCGRSLARQGGDDEVAAVDRSRQVGGCSYIRRQIKVLQVLVVFVLRVYVLRLPRKGKVSKQSSVSIID